MPEFLTKFMNQMKALFGKLSMLQKIIIGGALLLAVAAFAYLFNVSSEESKVLLYKEGLKKADYQRARAKLDGMGANYSTSDERYIYVDNEEKATKLRAQLGLDGVVRQLKGYELFDQSEYSTTDFERKVNLRRAITANIIRHLEALEDIERAEVTISFPDKKHLFKRDIDENPVKASVSITPAPHSDLIDNKKKIKGIRDFIAKGVDRLKPDNIIIMDQVSGVNLTEKLDVDSGVEDLQLTKEQNKIKNQLIARKKAELETILSKMFTDKRYGLTVDYQIDWTKQEVAKRQIDPIEIVADNPDTPFSERQTVPSIDTSIKEENESLHSPGYIPEGPAGVPYNATPGEKEIIDRVSVYKKKSKISNKEFSSSMIQQVSPIQKIDNVTVGVIIDGTWEVVRDQDGEYQFTKEGKLKRKYTPVSDQELSKVKSLVESSLFKKRGDKADVKHFTFDRQAEHLAEDERIREELRNRRLLFVGVAVILGILILILLFRAIKKEIDRRRRLREEEFARQQQLLREQALRVAEEDVSIDIPPEDKARLEMQENAINIARERPEDVAQLIRTWLVEE